MIKLEIKSGGSKPTGWWLVVHRDHMARHMGLEVRAGLKARVPADGETAPQRISHDGRDVVGVILEAEAGSWRVADAFCTQGWKVHWGEDIPVGLRSRESAILVYRWVPIQLTRALAFTPLPGMTSVVSAGQAVEAKIPNTFGPTAWLRGRTELGDSIECRFQGFALGKVAASSLLRAALVEGAPLFEEATQLQRWRMEDIQASERVWQEILEDETREGGKRNAQQSRD